MLQLRAEIGQQSLLQIMTVKGRSEIAWYSDCISRGDPTGIFSVLLKGWVFFPSRYSPIKIFCNLEGKNQSEVIVIRKLQKPWITLSDFFSGCSNFLYGNCKDNHRVSYMVRFAKLCTAMKPRWAEIFPFYVNQSLLVVQFLLLIF